MKIDKALQKASKLTDEELIELDELFRDYVLKKKTVKSLAEEHGVSVGTISNRVSLARAALLAHLQADASKYISDVFVGFWKVYEDASREFDNTRDVKFLTESRKALGDIAMLLGLRAAPKAARNDDPLAPADSGEFLFVLDESEYKKAEATFKTKGGKDIIIEGDIIDDVDN